MLSLRKRIFRANRVEDAWKRLLDNVVRDMKVTYYKQLAMYYKTLSGHRLSSVGLQIPTV